MTVFTDHSEKQRSVILHQGLCSDTALDDLFISAGRNEETEWTLKNDLMPISEQNDSHSRGAAVCPDDAISETLAEASCSEGLIPGKASSFKKGVFQSRSGFNNLECTDESVDNSLKEDSVLAGKSPQSKNSCPEAFLEKADRIFVGCDGISSAPETSSNSIMNSFGDVDYWDGTTQQPCLQFMSHCLDRTGAGSVGGKTEGTPRKEVQKPPTTAGIGLEDLKAVFHLERPKAEKKLRLKRTTFSNLSRHFGISKWPFRTIRDAMNRMQANSKILKGKNISKERRRKLIDQQRLLSGVIALIYSDPRESRDSNTLAVLLRIVAARESHFHCAALR